MHPGLFAVCMFCYCISFKFGSFIFINLCASKGNREKKVKI
jgi:hypothetical protein